MDRTTQLLLGAIALGLFANALALGGSPVRAALAGDTMDCRFDGTIDVRITSMPDLSTRVTSIDDDIEVDWGFSEPGSSSTSPLYIRSTD